MKNIVAKILLLTVLLSFALALASCEKDEFAPPAGMTLASDEKADFYFYVPDEWTVDYTTAAAGAYFSASDPSSVSVMAWELEHTDSTVEDWWQINVNDLSMVFTDFALQSEENTMVNELYAKQYVYTANLGQDQFKYMQVACVKNATVYLFTYASTADNFDAHLEDVNEMLSCLIIK